MRVVVVVRVGLDGRERLQVLNQSQSLHIMHCISIIYHNLLNTYNIYN